MRLFLRLFPQFLALEAEAASARLSAERWEAAAKSSLAGSERLMQQVLDLMDERDGWKSKSAQQDAEIARLNASLIDKADRVADTMSVHAIGKRFFSKASEQPPAAAGKPMQPPAVNQRQARAAMNNLMSDRQYFKQMFDALPSDPPPANDEKN